MAPSAVRRWDQIRTRKLAGPGERERYERTRRTVIRMRQILQLIDTERQKAGLSKAELAERAGAPPASIRRLLTADSSNPTLHTLLDLFDALGLELSVTPAPHSDPDESRVEATALLSASSDHP